MGVVIRLRKRHARASESTGYKSGRKSCREIPVAASIGRTNSAGTPRFDRASQYQTCDCVVPIFSASRFWPPAALQANFKGEASSDMTPTYPFLGELQPKNLSGTKNKYFGTGLSMKEADPKAFGERIRQRRDELGLSQTELGRRTGYSQQRIASIEDGNIKNPVRAALAFSMALNTSPDWLLWKDGPKSTGKTYLSPRQLARKYEALSVEEKVELSEYIENIGVSKKKRILG